MCERSYLSTSKPSSDPDRPYPPCLEPGQTAECVPSACTYLA